MNKKPFQFGLHDLLWLILLAGVTIGWYADRTQQQREINKLKAASIMETLRVVESSNAVPDLPLYSLPERRRPKPFRSSHSRIKD